MLINKGHGWVDEGSSRKGKFNSDFHGDKIIDAYKLKNLMHKLNGMSPWRRDQYLKGIIKKMKEQDEDIT